MPAAKWPWLINGFRHYTQHYLQRSFHAIHLLGEPAVFRDDGSTPLVVCLNHSSWWDVLVPFYLERLLFGWDIYGVMDARQLDRYRIFAHMGMIGVDRTSLAGTREFLATCQTLLKGQRRALWLTPQGEMISNYRRPLTFQPGLGHVAVRLERFYLIYVTLHYEFWNERLPEAFVSISPARLVTVETDVLNPRQFVRQAEQTMQIQLDTLLAAAECRDPAEFRPLLRGTAGVSFVYDLFRSLQARCRGEQLAQEHGALATPRWKSRRHGSDE